MRIQTWTLAAALLGACSSAPTGFPALLSDVPDRGTRADALVASARELQGQGNAAAAMRALDSVIEVAPRHVDAHRARQDLLRTRGRLGLVLTEAEQRIVEWNADPLALYLRGRVQRHDAQKRLDFQRVIAERPNSFWGWIGLAFTLRGDDPSRATALYRALVDSSDGHLIARNGLAEALRNSGDYDGALAVYEAMRGVPSMAGIGELGIVNTQLLSGKAPSVSAELLTALRFRPQDPGVHFAVRNVIRAGPTKRRVERLLSMLYEDPQRMRAFEQAAPDTLASLFEAAGQLPAARALFADRAGSLSAEARRRYRRMMLAAGDVVGYLRELRASTPLAVIHDERNQVRSRWAAVLDGPWMNAEDPLADPRQSLTLCKALTRAGLLEEVDLIAAIALSSDGTPDAMVELRDEVRREIAFERALRTVLYEGYRTGDTSLDKTLELLRAASQRIFGEDVVGEPERYSIPLVGELLDPFRGALARHLGRYNRHLVLGQRWAGGVEGLLLNRLSLRELGPSRDLPLVGRCMEVVGDDRKVRSLTGVLGGDLAGVALLSHYVVDYDAVRDWAKSIRDRREIARADDLAVLDDPLPQAVDALEPVDVKWRLSLLSSVEDDDLDAAVFDMICAHERAHLVDSFYYLPPGSNLWRVLGLVLAHGFDALSVESEMEGRAEAGALVASPHTRLVLAHIAGFLESDSEESPHAVGFRRLAAFINDRLAEDPELVELARASRWHLLPVDRVRAIGREYLER